MILMMIMVIMMMNMMMKMTKNCRHLCEHNDDINHQKMADNKGIQIKEILAKADGGCPRGEDFEAVYLGYVFGPDGKPKERPNVYIAEKLRLYLN